jgi:mRNA (2'-O-methyladenosine-N6-)-methyltransferase
LRNDYNVVFIETGDRPQNYIRDTLPEERFVDYPKLNELIKLKDDLIRKRSHPAAYIRADLKDFDFRNLSKFDVILMDPPWEEYVRRVENYQVMQEQPWLYEEIANIPIEDLADTPSFIFLWVGSENLDAGRALFRKWGFKRIEDIVWLKTNKNWKKETKKSVKIKNSSNSHTLLQCVKEHCLVGLKGDVKRASDSYFIHANIDTDIIVDEEAPLGSTAKPKEIYEIIERFCLGRRRLELFGNPDNIRPGWLTIGNALPGTNYKPEEYDNWIRNEKFVGTTPEIENLRPKSPKNSSRGGGGGGGGDDLPPRMSPGVGNMNVYHTPSPNMKGIHSSPMAIETQYQSSGYKYSGYNQSPSSANKYDKYDKYD